MSNMTNGILDFLNRQFVVPGPSWPNAAASTPTQSIRPALGLSQPPSGVANRLAFQRLVYQQLDAGKPLAVMMLDIDGLGRINDQFGFEVGDALLEQFGEFLHRVVPYVSTVAHLFSDEFAILVPGVHASHEAEGIAVRITRALDVPFIIGDHVLRISASMGIAHSPIVGDAAAQLIPAASRALVAAKACGGGAWRAFDRTMLDDGGELRQDLPFALARQEIIPFYQPIVEIATGRIVGLEVLARWHHPSLGLLLPDQFIKPMEREGILNGLTTCLVHQVAQDAIDWPANWIFSFNIAPTQIRELATYVLVQPKPPLTTLPPHRIEIEISESALIDDVEATRHLVDLLQAKGARVALDNFGGDRANIRHICGIPFNRLKVSRAFMGDIMHDARAGICVRSIADIGRQLGIDVTAEGIATEEMAARVGALGCRYGQGSYFAMPVPADAVSALIERLPWRGCSAASQPLPA
jgi:diguanylate cyclase (GGDEF)-like protein